ncbi:hypothetical protein [Chryseobacterium defluvii]|uniref:hypothetical protein n=1 Tax=Chryseobacterium defluvii TaxID=160396 RepID=UPI0011C4051F|nr:hypothetical protein [Chryseobacterium defluvii]
MKIKIKIKKSEFKALAESGLIPQLLQEKKESRRILRTLMPLSFYRSGASTPSYDHQSEASPKIQSELKDSESEDLNPLNHP